MDAQALRGLFVAAAILAGLPAGAEPPPASCQLPSPSVDPLTDRAGLLAQYERLPPACLRALFAACSQASSHALLDFGSAAACSFGYEALLSQGFGGSFPALMAWWRSERGRSLP
jgi:hypothetical protein